jgi:NAD(P)-dependent dehydrogenase (short-subunit alcohol dehydrogenase family)
MPTILISGAASGLGKAFLDILLRRADCEVIAIDRSPIRHVVHERLRTFEVDVSSPYSIKAFAQQIYDTPVHLFIHSVGIRGLAPLTEAAHPQDVAAAETLEVMDIDTMMRAFQINAAGTFLIIQALLSNFILASSKANPTKVVIMGSRMGSISYNTTGGAYAYRASKAGLNAIVKSLSIDVPEVIFTVLHPGRVETGLVKCREEGAIEAEESIEEMMEVIERLADADSGKFYDRFGKAIGW